MLTKSEQSRLVASLATSCLAVYFWDKIVVLSIILAIVSTSITVYDYLKTKW